MAIALPELADPTLALPIDFEAYVEQRERQQQRHLVEGIPDYSFSLDRRLRARLTAIAPIRWATRALVHHLEPIYQHLYTMQGVAVGPNQYPEIHALGEKCAERLGIGVPRIFVVFSPEPNAMTLASDDTRPSILLTTGLVRALSEAELLAVIGHECGHIHNLHGAFHALAELVSNPLARALLSALTAAGVAAGLLRLVTGLLQTSMVLFLARWSRCAEVTCDRAGAICANDARMMMSALARIQTGGEESLRGIDLDTYVRQVSVVKKTPVRLLELGDTHPLAHKRVEAVRLFSESDVYRSWCASDAPATRLISEVDADCEALIRVWDTHSAAERKSENNG
ncbi:M48 family metallopeptidase [Candidatus Accumulibacter vicinus]|uniref:Peptidase M48 domain-containing protein n=1 Tax=Candidatus Accumulibacter vicinus TaxID=2954382 RepID=A0A084Y095_9PROT|nr:M48 family metallopeptidase [Candidatus Accumulibacter vicinus]KFB68139.1 MAG: hypothetical protein CAPSK01_001991 [Candidatus Accumulibacter vicinus]